MRPKKGRSNTAIAFTLKGGVGDMILPTIYERLRAAAAHGDVTESRLNGTIYVEPFTTGRARKRAVGVLRGFSLQVDQDSVTIIPIDQVEDIFNAARRQEEKRVQFFPV